MSDAVDDLGKYGHQIALYDSRVDQHFISLQEFPLAEQALCGLGIFRDRFGENACQRVALQFVYELLGRIDQPVFETRTFEDYWSAAAIKVEQDSGEDHGDGEEYSHHADGVDHIADHLGKADDPYV